MCAVLSPADGDDFDDGIDHMADMLSVRHSHTQKTPPLGAFLSEHVDTKALYAFQLFVIICMTVTQTQRDATHKATTRSA